MSYIVIDDNLRTMTIPTDIKLLGVESDEDVNRIQFIMPKEYCGFDLSQFEARINYLNAKGEGDLYVVNDLTIDGDDPTKMTFSWIVGRNACKYKGDVQFIVCLKRFSNDESGDVIQEFNTTVYSLPVLKGLETIEAVVNEYPDIIESILKKVDFVENVFNASNYIPYDSNEIYHSEQLDVIKDGYTYSIDGINTSGSNVEVVLFDSDEYSQLKKEDFAGKTAIISGIYPNAANNERYYLRTFVDDTTTDTEITAETNVIFVDVDVTRIELVFILGTTSSTVEATFVPYINFNYANSQQQLTRDVQTLKNGLIMDVSDVGF